jgi:hypothetical protein
MMQEMMDHLEAVRERGNIFELFFTVLWALPVYMIVKTLNFIGVKTK